jgi:hypothetical protein
MACKPREYVPPTGQCINGIYDCIAVEMATNTSNHVFANLHLVFVEVLKYVENVIARNARWRPDYILNKEYSWKDPIVLKYRAMMPCSLSDMKKNPEKAIARLSFEGTRGRRRSDYLCQRSNKGDKRSKGPFSEGGRGAGKTEDRDLINRLTMFVHISREKEKSKADYSLAIVHTAMILECLSPMSKFRGPG